MTCCSASHSVAVCGDSPAARPGTEDGDVAGLMVWALSYLYCVDHLRRCSASHSMGLVLLGIVWSAVEMLIASAVGGYLYTEGLIYLITSSR